MAAGNPVMESYPRQCRDGKTLFTEFIGNELEKIDLIRLDWPRPNDSIISPVTVRGEAVGNWYFEGDFPIELYDFYGTQIGEGYASAQGEWMTEDFVSFETQLEFTKPMGEYGLLIFTKG